MIVIINIFLVYVKDTANNYTTNPSEAKTLDFTYSSDTPISKISVNYLSKPHYVENSKDNGINLEIFSLIVKK